MRVLLVEDDLMIGDAIQGALRDASYAADWVKDGHSALTTLACQHYDLVLLDLGLPGKDGFEVLAGIRVKENPIPLLIITARDGLDDRLRGLDGGADDYVSKPFQMAELLARMRAVLRRKGGTALPVLSNGVVSLDPVTREASIKGGSPHRLTVSTITEMMDSGDSVPDVEVGTLYKWSSGKTFPDAETLSKVMEAHGLRNDRDILYQQFNAARLINLLGYLSEDIAAEIRELGEPAAAWPWPAYPFGYPDFESWVANRYPFWLAFHQKNGAALAELAKAAPTGP